jgi:hypothetical protein
LEIQEGRKMRATRILSFVALAACLVAAGCATYDQGSTVPASTGLGAAAGALLGYGLTGEATGAAAGAGAGALAGAIGGVIIDETKRSKVQPAPAPAPQAYQQPTPQPQAAPYAYATQPDPTSGEFNNNTGWRLEIYVDDASNPVYLAPRQSHPLNLDIGNHQVVAKAYVSTKFGERLVGTYSRSIYVDPKGSGWSLRFDETLF